MCRGAVGSRFWYLLNAPYQGSDQFDSSVVNRLVALLGVLVDVGVGGVIVSLPHIATVVKRRFPALGVGVS